MMTKNPYPGDVPDDEWEFVAQYLTLLPEDAGQRHYDLRVVYNALRWIVRTGATWRMMPNDLPPWSIVYQRMPCWLNTDCSEAMVDELRLVLREAKGRRRKPSATIFNSRTLQSIPRGRACGL